MEIVPADDHGTDLLTGPQGEVVSRLIETYLAQFAPRAELGQVVPSRLGNGVPSAGPGNGAWSRFASSSCTTAAPTMRPNSTMIVISVNRRTPRG